MADAKSTLARDGTMQVTAKEGIQFLKDSGHTELLQMQGLKDEEPSKPSVARDTTMAATAKEGEKFKEGVDPDSFTRGQQKKIEEIQKEKTEPKKTKMTKEGTMEVTAKEGKTILGDEKFGDTRQETAKSKAKKPAANKRETTIAKTMAEAKNIVSEEDLTGGRRTRSYNKPAPVSKPAVKRAGTMQRTAKEGKEFVKKAKKGAKKQKKAEEIENEDEVDEKEEEEEKGEGEKA